jgi:EmrB/QacA subfamily drug resistance transporter
MRLFALNRHTRPWWTLIGACGGLFVLMLDSTVVPLAIPSIHDELDASLQWVMNGYLLVIAALTITFSRLGDMFGRRLVFVLGVATFAAGSVLSAVAWNDVVLVLGRLVQGTGAAAMLGLSLAIVCDAFPGGKQARALGIWAAVSAIALAIGPVVGGALVALDWRLIFWINLPICLLTGLVIIVATRESRDETAGRRVDVPGLITLTAGLTAIVLALIEAQAWGWGSARTIGVLCLGLVALVAFWVIEHRVSEPIVEFPLFRNGPYFGATAAAFALVGSYWGVMFFEPQYLQDVLGHSAFVSGLLILPITAPMVAISPLAGRMIARFGARPLMTVGMLCGVGGVIVMTRITDTSGYGLLLPGFLLFGIALGLVYAPMSVAAMAAMPRAKAGIAAGVLAMNRVLAGAIALAATGALFQSLQTDKMDELGHGAKASDDAFVYALSNAFWVLVGLTAMGALLTWQFVRSAKRAGPDPAVAGKPPRTQLQHHWHHRRFHL